MRIGWRTKTRPAVLAAVAALAGAAVVTGPAAPRAAAATAVSVTVNGTAGLGTVPGGAIGLNTAVYDGFMNDTPIPGLLKAAGINALRYPGGSYSDIYNWQNNTAPGGYVAPNTSFADFMKTAQGAAATPVITVNYGTGTPALAASWVQNAAVTNHDGVSYWEVGNEVYGNGTYGADWETDSHCQTASGTPVTVGSEPSQTYNCGPGVYATNVLSYMSAMKAVSPGAHVCAVLTTPGNWPDNVTNPQTSPLPWNQTVLTTLGAKTDCVIVHYYPGGADAAAMLTATGQIPGIVATVKSEVSQYAKVDPATVPILVSEANSTVDMDTQPNALFAADMYMTWLENGVANVDWWDEHNGPGTNPPSVVNGAQDYGDYGVFSVGGNNSGVTEPAAETPFAPYYGIAMLSRLSAPGDTMVTSTSSNSLVRVHAVRRSGGSLAVLIDNEDPGSSYTVNLAYNGFTPAGSPTVYTFADNGNAITSATQSSSSAVTVAPYTLTVVQVPGGGGGGVTAPGAPGLPTVSGLASSTSGSNSGVATLSWPAAAAGTYPVASYQVYRQLNGGSTLVGTTSATTLSLSGLTIGTSYTYDVVAVDSHANPSLPSAPVSFTVPPPADAGCAVHYAVNNSWPGGFGAAITVTNRSATALTGWKLTFTWPDAGEGVQSGWNGTWTQSGSTVTVVNADWNGAVAANGGTVGLGFNGSDTGQLPAPTVFSLNGTVCATT